METKDNGFGLQDWQQQVLDSGIRYNSITIGWENILTTSQSDMLKKILSWNLFKDESEKGLVERVLEEGYYFEGDKESLNKIRRRYLSESNYPHTLNQPMKLNSIKLLTKGIHPVVYSKICDH